MVQYDKTITPKFYYEAALFNRVAFYSTIDFILITIFVYIEEILHRYYIAKTTRLR